MKRFFFILHFLFIILYPLNTLSDEKNTDLNLKFSNEAPAGFEDLAAPQHVLLDIYYAGKRVGNAFATFSSDSFEFDKPKKITAMISHLKETAVNQVTQALTGQLELHSELVCQKPAYPKDCGLLSPLIAGIIFNEGYFKVEIFVHPDLLKFMSLNMSRYLPWAEEEAGLNAVINLSGAITGGSKQALNYNLRNTNIFSHHLIRLRNSNTFSRQQGLRIESLVAEKEWQNWLLSLGMFESTPLRLIGQQDVLGLRFGSSLKMRTDLKTAYGNQLSIFLPRRALVKVFRDGRLLLSQIYQQGNQVIDSRNFPEGAYDVTLVIDDQLGETKTETRFFSKATEIPPLDSPSYFAEIGLMRRNSSGLKQNFPRYSNKLFAQLGSARRFNDSFGADASLLFADGESIASLGLFFIHPFLDSQLRLGGIISSSGAYGAEISALVRYQNFSTYFEIRKIWNKNNQAINQFSILPNAFTQANFASSYSLFNTDFGVKGQWQQRYQGSATQTSYNISPFIRRTLFQSQNFRVSFDAQYTLREKDSLVFANINIDFRQPISKKLTLSSHLKGEYRSDNQQPIDYRAKLGLELEESDFWQGQISNRLEFERRPQGLIAHNDNTYKSNYGRISSFFDYTLPNNKSSQMRYGADFNVSFLGEPQNIVVGGNEFKEAVILIDLQGTPKDAVFEVLVAPLAKNHYQETIYTRAFVGKVAVIALDAYESYSIRLLADKTTFAEYDTNFRQVTLYPGHIRYLTWKIREVFILLTTIIKDNGELLKNAKIEGAIEPAYIGDNGFLQAEVESGSVLTVNSNEEGRCQIKIPDSLKAINGVVILKELVCYLKNK